MARIFISHSSQDKAFVKRLANDLGELNHQPWLDEYAIRVGDCIISKLERGIEEADYLIVVLSPASVASGWVEREWKTKYWNEVSESKTLVLPLLLTNCDVPPFLKTKKYADFRNNYSIGLMHLRDAIEPLIRHQGLTSVVPELSVASLASALLPKVQSRSTPLAQCIAEAMNIARAADDKEFDLFCRQELAGYDDGDPDNAPERVSHRTIEVFASPKGKINTAYMGWSESLAGAIEFMRRETKDFFPQRLAILFSVAKIEAAATNCSAKGLITFTLRWGDLLKETKTPEAEVLAYGRGDSYASLLEGIRQKLTEYLLRCMPISTLKE